MTSDETPLSRVRAFQRAANPNGDYHWPAEEAAKVGGVPLYFDDIEALASTDELDAVEVAIRRLREAEAAAETLREQLSAATARAETAEAAYHRLDSAQAAHGSYAGRAEAAEAERNEQRTRATIAEAAVVALRGQRDVAKDRAEQAEAELCSAYLRANRAENAAAEFDKQAERYHARALKLEAQREQLRNERDQLRARLAEIGKTEVEYGVHHGALGVMGYGEGERYARHVATKASRPLMRRLAGEWRDADAPSHDASGWTAAENAEFDNLYGTEAAMRYRAQLNRVWRIVQDLRDEAVAAGLDPYQDPMAQRLSAALVGAANDTTGSPE